MNSPRVGSPAGAPNNGTNLSAWIVAINQHLANDYNIITNLYAKGCRVLVAPNVTNVTAVPEFNQSPSAWRAFVRQRIIGFNTNYMAMLNQITAGSPGLRIYVPDVFQLLDNVLTNAAFYGLTNALLAGQPIDAVDALPGVALNGAGNNYVFWDCLGNPNAKMHEVLADIVQQMISPVQFSRIIPGSGSNRLDMVNLPIGMSGWVCCATNLSLPVWQTNSFVLSGDSATQSIFVSRSGAQQFYRLDFPWQWSWP